MGSRKIIMLVGSILIGALAGFALLNYVNNVEQDIVNEQARVEVWVVAADIAAGTTANDVNNTGRLEQRLVETHFRPTNAVTDLSQIQGRIAVNNLAANQILVTGMFDDPEAIETTFNDLIEPDQIAFTISIDPLRAVGGQVEPGDFVDIIVLSEFTQVTVDGAAGGLDVFEAVAQDPVYETPARFLFRGVRIVGINRAFVGQPTTNPDGTPVAPAAAPDGALQLTLALPADAAQKILSVPTEDMVLALHPEDWEPEARPNEIPELIQLGGELPGENPTELTPYGPDGFLEALVEDAADATTEDATTEDAALPEGSADDDLDGGAEDDTSTEGN